MIIEIKALEPLVFNQAGEFNPGTIGLEKFKNSYPLPNFTSILGCLGSLFYKEDLIDKNSSYMENIRKILTSAGLKDLRYLLLKCKINNECRIYFPVNIKGEIRFYEVSDFQEKIKSKASFNELEDYLISNIKKTVHDYLEDQAEIKDVLIPIFSNKIGIKLKDFEKSVESGHLFSVKYLNYKPVEGNPVLEYSFLVLCSGSVKHIKDHSYLGGERRSVLVLSHDDNLNIDLKINKNVDNSDLGLGSYLEFEDKEGYRIIVLTSPIELPESIGNEVCMKEIMKYVEDYITGLFNIDNFTVFGSIEPLGGFDILRGKRKPIKLYLSTGSLIWER